MKRILFYILVMSSGIVLIGCDFQASRQDSIQKNSAQSARSMSIAGMPVYDKDFKLEPLLANDTQLKPNQQSN